MALDLDKLDKLEEMAIAAKSQRWWTPSSEADPDAVDYNYICAASPTLILDMIAEIHRLRLS